MNLDILQDFANKLKLPIAIVEKDYYLDMGFLQRVEQIDHSRDTIWRLGYHNQFIFGSYRIFPKDQSKILSYTFGIRNFMNYSDDLETQFDRGTEFSYEMELRGQAKFSVELENNSVRLLYPFSFTDKDEYEPLPVGVYDYNTANIEYESDTRKKFSYEVNALYGGFYNGTRLSLGGGLKYRIQPWGSFGFNIDYNDLDFPEIYGNRELFLLRSRIEIGFNRNVFWTTFLQLNTQSDNFNINSRFQWRFKPMSDLFIVYTDNYTADGFGAKNRALVFKLNYWFQL